MPCKERDKSVFAVKDCNNIFWDIWDSNTYIIADKLPILHSGCAEIVGTTGCDKIFFGQTGVI